MKRKVLTLVSGVMSAQVITILAMPVISRIYSPEDIGAISLLITVFSLVSSVAALRYDSVIIVANKKSEKMLALQCGVFFTILTSILTTVVTFFVIQNGYGGFGVFPLWACIAIGVCILFEAIFLLLRSILLSNENVKPIRNATLSRSIYYALSRIVLGFSGLHLVGLIISEIIRTVASMGQLLRYVNLSILSKVLSIKYYKTFIKKYIDFQKFELPSILLNQIGLALPIICISSLFGAKQAGYFAFAKLLVAIPSSQIGKSFSDVYQIEIAKLYNRDNLKLKSLFFENLKKLAIYGGIVYIAIMILAKPMVPIIFGDEWVDMATVCVLISPWLYGSFVAGALSRTLIVLRAQKVKLIYDSLLVILISATYYVSKVYFLSFFEYVVLLSVVGFLLYGIYLTIISVVVKRC
ncbi:oligosaccharide flippase family protein [Shewanella olleyana]|uniref:lipopolysaccharide biosynthesis protein n=1 Tax=Shewanella olleyana TaxID=135626 RepID=UPI0020103229|nr:oligosaccharide flippase family protein [Shewanella olleyana]MCL1067036.1 oligosaccharide flippase family protein [Shewanella olleyana]